MKENCEFMKSFGISVELPQNRTFDWSDIKGKLNENDENTDCPLLKTNWEKNIIFYSKRAFKNLTPFYPLFLRG